MSLVLDVPRELQEDEVKLIREVASAMDPAIALSCEKRGESSTVTIAYNRSAPIRFINALKTLIFGICKTYNSTRMPLTERAAIGDKAPPFEEARKADLFTAAQAPTPQQLPSLQKAPIEKQLQSLQKVPIEKQLQRAPSEKQELSPVDDEEGEETPGQFERPMSLKGQRHVFLYKCRYSQLKSIIDHCGCWGLRMASLQEKWPCLVVYCAKSREEWMNAFRKIQKLERADFLRKRVSDSIRNVDMKKLEELTQTYGQKCGRRAALTRRNACISLCVQSPSSPENPSVSVCGLTSYVENLYRVFVEYHLAAEDDASAAMHPPTSTPARRDRGRGAGA